MTDFIKFSDVSKCYESAAGRFTALQQINLDIPQGEFLAVVGKSGSGKSTLLNMLTGIDHPSEGNVTIKGVQVHTLNESSLANWRGKNIGIVFQFFQLIPTLTICENILLAMDFVNVVPKDQRTVLVDELLQRVGILEHRNKFPAALSGGEQQRAAIARALANNPPILVADEPTGNLDSHTARIIQELFNSLVDAGKTVIVVTHEQVLRENYSRVITLKDGLISDDQRQFSLVKEQSA